MKYYVIKVGEPVRDDNGIISNRLELIAEFAEHNDAMDYVISNTTASITLGIMIGTSFNFWFNGINI